MKFFVVLVISFFSGSIFAMPVLNKAAPAGDGIMVYVDHLDPNLYYLSPETIVVKKDTTGRPIFSYFEYRGGDSIFSGTQAIIQMLMEPAFNAQKIESAKSAIRVVNPNALFASLPFVNSSIAFTPDMEPLVFKGSCSHGAGDIGQAVDCTIDLTTKGRKVIGGSLKAGQIFTVQFRYDILGVIQGVDGTYSAMTNSISVAGAIGGPDFKAFPELFRD